jgi:hypothetical protein
MGQIAGVIRRSADFALRRAATSRPALPSKVERPTGGSPGRQRERRGPGAMPAFAKA